MKEVIDCFRDSSRLLFGAESMHYSTHDMFLTTIDVNLRVLKRILCSLVEKMSEYQQFR
jgi:hypothetical protein